MVSKKQIKGFTYLNLLFLVAMMGTTLALTGILWKKTLQQEKERQLLFVGNQFRRAILLYYERSPSATKQYPKSLAVLLGDNRYPFVQRYLREIYKDPITGNMEWGTVKSPDGGIMGIYSLSGKKPQKMDHFPILYSSFKGSNKYSDWIFQYRP